MAELSRGAEDENQEQVIAPVNYSPEVEAAIQEVFLVRSRAILLNCSCRYFLALMNWTRQNLIWSIILITNFVQNRSVQCFANTRQAPVNVLTSA